MKIVIDIPEEIYDFVQNTSFVEDESTLFKQTNAERQKTLFLFDIMDAIRNGEQLPKHHGRLIDADRTLATAWTNFYKHEDEWEKKDNNYLPIGRMYDQNGFECCQQTIVNAPTIIEPYKTESEDNEE